MGVTADDELLGQYGEILRALPAQEPVLPRPVVLAPGQMSTELADVQNRKARAAVEFAFAKDVGIAAAGTALTHIAANLADFDRRGAAAIAEVLPEPGPAAGGGADDRA